VPYRHAITLSAVHLMRCGHSTDRRLDRQQNADPMIREDKKWHFVAHMQQFDTHTHCVRLERFGLESEVERHVRSNYACYVLLGEFLLILDRLPPVRKTCEL